MIKEFKEHSYYYLSLLIMVLLGSVLIIMSSPYIYLQMLFAIITISFYVVWGIMHHKLHHDLYLKVVVEYILIGFLVIAILYFLTG